MSTPNPVIKALAPEAVAILKALEAFDATMGTDPTQWALRFPGAKLVLDGTILSEVPVLNQAAGALVMGALNGQYGKWIAELQKVSA